MQVNEDYLSYWGMTKPPFSLTPDPEMLYLSSQHSECLMRLKYAIFSHKGGALLVSDNAGNGKTSIIAKLKKDLDDYYGGRVKVVVIDHPTLTPIEMISEIGHQLGTELHTNEKIKALNSLRDQLFNYYNQNIKVIVIVDEGQMLKERPDILGELRILLNFCVSDAFLLTFIFSGQKPLDSILREMPEFWQRLPVRYFLKNLNFNDTKALVKYRLGKVGASEDIFKDDAFDGIYNYSDGCPRVICSVADLCLIIGFAKGIKRIGFVEVSTACRDMESSGDGFHYYAYLQSQQTDLFSEGDKKVAADVVSPAKPASQPKKPAEAPAAPAAEAVKTIVCAVCGQPTDASAPFCTHCDAPVKRKCPKCLQLVDTFTGECPVCHSSIEAELRRTLTETKEGLKKFDSLDGGHSVWLSAKDIKLLDGEIVIAILPRGNMLSPGPVIIPPDGDGKTKQKGDLVLTDKRLILSYGDKFVNAGIERIGSIVVTDTSAMFGKKPVFVVDLAGGKYRIELPFGAAKNRKVMQIILSFIQTRKIT